MPRPVRTVDPLSIGSGARLQELFKVPRWFAVTVLVARGVFRQWQLTLSFLLFVVLWIYIGSFMWSWILVLLLWVVIIGSYWVFMGGGLKTGWWYWQLHRKWRHAMLGVGLKSREGGLIPRIRKVRPIKGGLRMDVNMTCAGRILNDLRAEAEDIAEIIGARRVQVHQVKKIGYGRLVLLWTSEPVINATALDEYVENVPDDGYGDYSKLVIGKTGSGPAVLSLMLSILIAGLSNSGKSTLLRALFHTVIRNRIPHELYVIDPAGGVELGELEHYPYTLAYCEDPDDAERVIKKAHADLKTRRLQMKAKGNRKITPSDEWPLRIILIDEMLMLPKGQLDDIRSELGTITTTGRKACTVVVGLTTLAQVDAIGRIRDAFSQRVCLATPSPEATDAALGKGAEAAGAKCSEIPTNMNGVGYYKNPDGRGYTRFRTADIPGSLLSGVEGVDTVSPNKNRKCARYRYYDVTNRALYIGKSFNPEKRAKQHAASALWYSHIDHTRTKIDWYVNEEEALRAETEAIRSERPIHNIANQKVISA